MKKTSEDIFEPPVPIVPIGWDVVPFPQAADVVSDKGRRVKQGSYLPAGKLPVIDQGQQTIGGFTDDEQMAFDGELPVILFGDHTRSIKFVDKPFAVGAEGVKILKPREVYFPKFLYYLLRSLRIPSRGYSRHFQFLRRFHFPLAPEEQQKRIVAEIEKQFSRLDEAVANLKRVKANLKRYKAAVLKAAVEGKLTEEWRKQHPDLEPASKLLDRILAERRAKWKGKGKYKEPGKPDVNDLAQLPQHWAWCLTDSLFSFVTSGSRGWAQYYSDEGALFLRIGNLDHDSIRLDLSDVQRVKPPAGAEGTRTKVESGDILISITADVGMIAVAPADLGDAYINQHVSLARPLNGFSREFLAWYLAASDGGQKMFLQLQRGATKVGLGLDDIRAVPVPLPPLAEQQEIVAEVERRLSVIEELEAAVEANLTRADRLRQSILSDAFAGKLVCANGNQSDTQSTDIQMAKSLE